MTCKAPNHVFWGIPRSRCASQRDGLHSKAQQVHHAMQPLHMATRISNEKENDNDDDNNNHNPNHNHNLNAAPAT
jgi:hypothetical protein